MNLRSAGAAMACASLLLAVGCSKDLKNAPARAVTADEAARLASMRLLNYQAKGVHFHTVVGSGAQAVTFDGDVDYVHKIGYAFVTGGGQAADVEFTPTTFKAWAADPRATTAPVPLPKAKPSSRKLDPTSSATDAALALVLILGQQKADSPQTVIGGGARWLRIDKVGSTNVNVYTDPRAASTGAQALVSYWLDKAGHMLRVDAQLGGAGAAITTFELDATKFRSFSAS